MGWNYESGTFHSSLPGSENLTAFFCVIMEGEESEDMLGLGDTDMCNEVDEVEERERGRKRDIMRLLIFNEKSADELLLASLFMFNED